MTIAIVNTVSPWGDEQARDSLDMAMVLATYEQDVTLFFKGQGVLQLKTQQAGQPLLRKDFCKTFAALDLYDIEEIYVLAEDLAELELSQADIAEFAQILPLAQFNQKLLSAQHVMRF